MGSCRLCRHSLYEANKHNLILQVSLLTPWKHHEYAHSALCAPLHRRLCLSVQLDGNEQGERLGGAHLPRLYLHRSICSTSGCARNRSNRCWGHLHLHHSLRRRRCQGTVWTDQVYLAGPVHSSGGDHLYDSCGLDVVNIQMKTAGTHTHVVPACRVSFSDILSIPAINHYGSSGYITSIIRSQE